MAKGGHSKGGAPRPPSRKASAPMRDVWKTYEAGDVKAARAAARAILAGSPAEEDAAEANDLLQRTAFPLDALKVAAAVAAVLVVLLVIAVLRG